MYQYTICNQPDEEIFRRQCAALEERVPHLKLVQELRDVDDSLIRMYEKDGGKVKIKNDFCAGGVFIDSDIELEQFFKE